MVHRDSTATSNRGLEAKGERLTRCGGDDDDVELEQQQDDQYGDE